MPLCLLYTLFSDVSVQIFCALFIWVVCFLVLFVFRIQEFNLTQRGLAFPSAAGSLQTLGKSVFA